jgi:putative signal transducing protein
MLPGRADRVAGAARGGVHPSRPVDVRSTGQEDGVVELVHVYESADPIRGLLVQGLLGSDGIEVFAKGEGTGPYRTGPVILFVDEADRDRALELIAAAQDGSLSLGLDEDLARETRTD